VYNAFKEMIDNIYEGYIHNFLNICQWKELKNCPHMSKL